MKSKKSISRAPAESQSNLLITANKKLMDTRFDDIRPYNESEIASAMSRIAENEHFEKISAFLFHDTPISEVRELIKGIRTPEDFQSIVMYKFNTRIIRETMTGFSYEGLENLDINKRYLFVSNHRDIVMDSAFLQQIFYETGYPTTQITFGSNLMSSQLIIDIGKSNKMFKVIRSYDIREFHKNSMHLSEYIRYIIKDKKESIWIAQRNGRTKDGNDATDQGIIKMFGMSNQQDKVKSILELNIVPVSISYQIEPCDVLKTKEVYQSRDGKYIKRKGEDLNSILTGILQPKGQVHIHIGKPLSEAELQPFANTPKSEFNRAVAKIIDTHIHSNYQLSCNNFIAFDLLTKDKKYNTQYTETQKEQFKVQINTMLETIDGEKDILQEIFLRIYANPLINKNNCLYTNKNGS
jgi:hypothetical protein